MSEKRKEIVLGNRKYLVVDLTQPLRLDVEVYPGDPKPQRKVFTDIGQTGWHHYIHEIGDHNFQPHGDGPNHQNPDLQHKGSEVFGLDYFFNSACLIDLSKSAQAAQYSGETYLVEVTLDHLKPFAKQLSSVGAVIIRTGYDRILEKNKPHIPEKLPYLSESAAEFIASFVNIKVVGIDSLTVDPPGCHTSHKILKDFLIVESLVHLSEIPVKNRSNFDLQSSIVRIIGATGGPVVAYAYIPS